ncbi:MAG: glycosyltransferase family 4 protein [Deltaproteobacteria bacterium]|nr:glycosyltransferase family 4 protein [Deltaproteobacteria bacterium]
MTKKLWILSELYHPETTSTGYILTKIAEGLAARGQFVNVLCSQPTYSARGTRAPVKEKLNEVEIHRCSGTTLDKDILFFRLINLLTITVSLFVKSLWRFDRGDSVLVVTNPPSLPFLVAVACRLRKANCVLLLQDVYPELLIAVGIMSPKSLLVRGFTWFNRILYRSVKHIVVVGRDMQAQTVKKLENDREKVSVITNWADIDTVFPTDKKQNALLRELCLQDRFVLEYAGNIGYPNDIKSIVVAAARLLEAKTNDIHFLFIGSGAKKLWLEEEVIRERLSNIKILPSRPRDDQLNFLNACDVALVSLVEGMKGVSVPSRTYNILAAGKPIIAIGDPESEVALVIKEEGVGWIVPPNNPEQLVKVIREAYSNPQLLAEMGRRARKVAEKKYSYESILNSFQKLFNSI